VNEDKAEGSNTAIDASSILIPPSQDGNSNVGGSQEDGEDSGLLNHKKKASIAEGEAMPEYFGCTPESENTMEFTERAKEGSCSEADPLETAALVANVSVAISPFFLFPLRKGVPWCHHRLAI